MTGEYDDILDGLFHAAAWAAYVEQAQAEQGWPDPEATRVRAFHYYEAALADKNRRKSRAEPMQAEEGAEEGDG
jgi:hypothetical protein